MTPTTEAGRWVQRDLEYLSLEREASIVKKVLAIEAEAAAAERARLRAAWDAVSAAIDDTHPEGCGCDLCQAADEMDALLAEPKP